MEGPRPSVGGRRAPGGPWPSGGRRRAGRQLAAGPAISESSRAARRRGASTAQALTKGDKEWCDFSGTKFHKELQAAFAKVIETVNQNPVVVTIVGQSVESARKRYASLGDGSFQAGLKCWLDSAEDVEAVKQAVERLIRLQKAA